MNKQTSTPAKASDNNRRLAALEAGVSALAMALAANGVALADGADPIEAAIAALKAEKKAHGEAIEGLSVMGAKVAALEAAGTEEAKAELEELRAKVAQLEATIEAGPTNATEGEIAAIARAEKAEGELAAALEEVKELTADVEDVMNEKNRLANAIADAGQSSSPPAVVDDEAEEAPAAAAERVRPETARDVGPAAGGLNAAELGELLASGTADGLELVFSNGEFEIVALAPVAIGAKELLSAEGRQIVIPPVFARLLNTDPQEELAGVGLLMQGEQISYCSFPDRLTLQPGSERRFDRAIYF